VTNQHYKDKDRKELEAPELVDEFGNSKMHLVHKDYSDPLSIILIAEEEALERDTTIEIELSHKFEIHTTLTRSTKYHEYNSKVINLIKRSKFICSS